MSQLVIGWIRCYMNNSKKSVIMSAECGVEQFAGYISTFQWLSDLVVPELVYS